MPAAAVVPMRMSRQIQPLCVCADRIRPCRWTWTPASWRRRRVLRSSLLTKGAKRLGAVCALQKGASGAKVAAAIRQAGERGERRRVRGHRRDAAPSSTRPPTRPLCSGSEGQRRRNGAGRARCRLAVSHRGRDAPLAEGRVCAHSQQTRAARRTTGWGRRRWRGRAAASHRGEEPTSTHTPLRRPGRRLFAAQLEPIVNCTHASRLRLPTTPARPAAAQLGSASPPSCHQCSACLAPIDMRSLSALITRRTCSCCP